MLDTNSCRPAKGRVYTSRRRPRLADRDATGRVRLDAVARFLQDAAIDDVQETGWGVPDHLWVVRSIQIDVLSPLLHDREIELATWCSGVAAIAAGRRWSVSGDGGGSVEIDSVWIHLDRDQRPARIGDFGPYGAAAGGRAVSTKLLLPTPASGTPHVPWQLRTTDIDAHGHVNNAVHWQAVEDWLAREEVDRARPIRVCLDYRESIEPSDRVELAAFADERGLQCLAFSVSDRVKAVASMELLAGA
jgi:acyl-ACP thioesterase